MSHKKTLRIIIAAAIIIVATFHVINVMYVFPSFDRLTISNAEKESLKIARHLSNMYRADEHAKDGEPGTSDHESEINKIMDDFGLEKVKVFSATGEIIYSSNPQDIGRTNTFSYFHEIVAKGNVRSKTIEKDRTTLEGRHVISDMVETYVPVMIDGRFAGAFEIYMDITEKMAEMRGIYKKYSTALLIGLIAFLSLVFVAIMKYDASLDKSILSGQVRGKYFTVLIIGLSLFITETIIMYIVPPLFGAEDILISAIVDSLLLLTVTSPLLYYFLFIPMYQQISATKKAENALRESERRFRLTFDDAPIGAAIVGMDGSIQQVNRKLCDYLGYTAEEFMARQLLDIVDPEERLVCATKISDIVYGELSDCNSDKKLLCKDGSSFWSHISMRLVTDSSGAPLYFLPMFEDINKRKQMEEEILRAKQIWEATFDSIPDSITILDDKSEIIKANTATRELAGVNDVEGMNICDLLCADKASFAECPCSEGMDTSGPTMLEYYNPKLDKHIEVRIIPRHDQKWRIEGYVHITRDITERKKAEEEVEKLSRAVSQSPVSVVIADPEGNIEYVNPKFTEVTGYSFDEALGSNPNILRSNEHQDDFYKDMWETILSGEVWRGEFCNKKKNGEIFWENAVISPIKNRDGKITHFVSVKEDITERKEAQDALLEAKAAAESANLAKSEFLARMSHEIRTPMNAIIGMSSLANMTELTPQQAEYISHISNASNALLKIINDILDFSKIEAGKYALESVEFRLEDVLKNIRSIIGVSVRDKALEMVFSVSDNVPETLVGDSLRIEQVLINLAANAVKFTQEGEVVLDVELHSMDEGHATLMFSVVDSGIGMTEEQMGGLFQPFAQADGSTTRKYGGTGLGLSISKRLIEMMGGEVEVSSALNEGSRFSFTAAFGFKDSESDSLDDLKGLRAMVLEDNWVAGECLYSALSDMGINAVTVRSIGEAKKEYIRASNKDEYYEIIFVDSSIAGMKDFEVFRSLREKASSFETKVILMKKQGDKSTLVCADRNICDACINKPALNTELIGAIRDVLDISSKNENESLEPLTGNDDQFENLRGHRVLLAEDNKVNQMLAVKLLEGAGIAVDTVKNGRDAVRAVETEDYDLVLMDVEMPIMDGLEATARIRSNPRHKELPIIAMTAHAMDEHRQRSFDAGMNGHISKPFEVEDFFKTIQSWINPGDSPSPNARHAEPENIHRLRKGLPAEIPGLDLQQGIENCDGDNEFYMELLVEFREHYREVADNIEAHISEGKIKKAMIEAHSLKGTAGTLGAVELQRASEELEAALLKGAVNIPEGLVEAVKDALSLVIKGLGSISSDPDKPADDSSTMYEALKDLEAGLVKSKPKRCASALQRLKTLDWHKDIHPVLNELETLVSQYKYHAARKKLDTLMKRFGEMK